MIQGPKGENEIQWDKVEGENETYLERKAIKEIGQGRNMQIKLMCLLKSDEEPFMVFRVTYYSELHNAIILC